MFDLGYEPAGLTVHLPSPQNDRGWVYFFRMGVYSAILKVKAYKTCFCVFLLKCNFHQLPIT